MATPALWAAINARMADADDSRGRAYKTLLSAPPDSASKALERAGRVLSAAIDERDPEAVLVSAHVLAQDGLIAPARRILIDHDDLCREYGDLAYLRGEVEMRIGFTPVAARRARRWARTARELGVSSSVALTPLRQSTQALILVGVGGVVVALAIVLLATSVLARSWCVILAVAGVAISVPGLRRHIAFHSAWGLFLCVAFASGVVVVAVL